MHADRELERSATYDTTSVRSVLEPAGPAAVVRRQPHDGASIFAPRAATPVRTRSSTPSTPAVVTAAPQPARPVTEFELGAAHIAPTNPSRTLEDELRSIFGNDLTLEANLGYLASSLEPATRAALVRRLESYRPGSGDDIAASFARLDAPRAARVLDVLRSGRGATSENEERAHAALQVAEADAATLSATLMPGYLAARDALDPGAVAELGGHALTLFVRMRATLDAAKLLDPLTTIADAVVEAASSATALAFVPYQRNGRLVADLPPPTVVVEGRPELARARLAGELQRTLGLIETVRAVELIVHSELARDPAWLERAQARILPWRTRPIDLAFLRAALGETWLLLDASVGTHDKLDEAFAGARKQAGATGWYSDTGKFDLAEARMWLGQDTRDGAETVLSRLFTADPDTRALLLSQLDHEALLEPFLDHLGWAQIKQLHDSLGVGFPSIKTALQGRFLGHDGFGPSLDREWNMHATSLAHYADKVPYAGWAFNTAADMATFGFHSEYGKLHDDLEEGSSSSTEWSKGWENLAVRTYIVGMASLMTAGLAEGAVGGEAATQTALRRLGTSVATNATLGTTSLATTDAVKVWITGEQSSFSSPEEYLKAAALGGAMGAAGFGLGQLSARARAYLGSGFRAGEPEVSTGTTTASPFSPEQEAAYADWSRTREGASVVVATWHSAGLSLDTLVGLTTEQRAMFDQAARHVEAGRLYDAIPHLDALITSGVDAAFVSRVGDGLSELRGTLRVSVLRRPQSFVPGFEGGRDVELARAPTNWPLTLNHGVNMSSGLSPEVVFENGLTSRGPNLNLLNHVNEGEGRAFRGSTMQELAVPDSSQASAGDFVTSDGWIIKMDRTPYWPVNQLLEGRVRVGPYAFSSNLTINENEKAILACVPRQRIISMRRVTEIDGRLHKGPEIPNPNYDPGYMGPEEKQ